MAKKHAKNAGFLIPEVVSQAPPPPRRLPVTARTLILPRLIREAATGAHIKPEARDAAYQVFREWTEKLDTGILHKLTEVQVHGDFANALLACLGFATHAHPDDLGAFSIIPEYAVSGGKKADLALGVFRFSEADGIVGPVRAVVELKGAGTDLDRKGHSGLTPVQQAWDYLNNIEGAEWAVVSNYEEIRLYHRRKGASYLYRVRLIDLRERDAFDDFYAVFHADALLGTGTFQPKTSWLVQRTEERQQDVGDELYDIYRTKRRELLHVLTTSHGIDRDTAIRAAQTLLDRILFIAFAEDRGLLNDGNTLKTISGLKVPLHTKWTVFQFLFEAIDLGDPITEIPQFTGELFKSDPILDGPDFQLDDSWPTLFKTIGDYDFRDEVTVDVLGKIFEQSIDDIERLKAGFDDEPETNRKAPGQRKLKGVFYTDANIVGYLVEAALQPAYDAERARLSAEFPTDPAALARGMLAWLDGRTVCDPSCGSGAFLNAAYDWFEERRLTLLKDLHDADPDDPACAGDPEDWRARSAPLILQNNLFGVDLSIETVEIARLSLWIRTARRGQTLTNLAANVVQGNSVVTDVSLDPLAFDWQARFPAVFAKGGFDAVIGNPPYVRQEHLSPIKPHLQANFAAYHGMADLYVYFYERGLSLLRPGGRLAYVVTNKWMKAGYGEPLRRHFGQESWVESVIDFGHAKQFFKDADVFPCFLVVRKPNGEPQPRYSHVCIIPRGIVEMDKLKEQVADHVIPVDRERFDAEAWQLEPEAVGALMAKIRTRGIPLVEFAEVKPYRGVLTGFNEAFLIDTPTRDRLVDEDPKSAEILKPYLRGQDIKRWSPQWSGLWMIFTRRGIDINAYPAIQSHLEQYKANLEPRPLDWDAAKGVWSGRKPGNYAWYEIQDSIDYWEYFSSPKIVFPEITWSLQWALDAGQHFCNNTGYILPTENRWILCVLNSPLCWAFSWRAAVHGKDEALRFISEFVDRFPIVEPKAVVNKKATKLCNRLITITRLHQSTRAEMLDWLKIQFNIDKPSTKLQDPIGMDSDGFLAEVKKHLPKKTGLSSPQVKTLREEYARSIDPARALAAEARGLEIQVHDLVNEAYGLTPEEVTLMWDTAPPRMPIPRPPGV